MTATRFIVADDSLQCLQNIVNVVNVMPNTCGSRVSVPRDTAVALCTTCCG
jgi:hypothetical protein